MVFDLSCVKILFNFDLEVTDEHKTFIMELNFLCSISEIFFMFSLNAILISTFQLFISIIIIFCFSVLFNLVFIRFAFLFQSVLFFIYLIHILYRLRIKIIQQCYCYYYYYFISENLTHKKWKMFIQFPIFSI